MAAGDDRHRRARHRRHAGPAAGQARRRAALPGRGPAARHRGLQLPARRRRRDEHRRRLRDLVLGARLRRLRDGAGPGDAARACRGSRAPRCCSPTSQWLDGTPVVESPRQILQRQLDRLAEHGWTALWSAPNSSSSSSTRRYESAWSKRYTDLTPSNQYNVDYSILGTSRVEPLLRAIRLGMRDAGMQVESAKGECNLGQHEIAFKYADALTTCDNHVDLQERREGDRGPARLVADVHGEVQRARGQLLPHPPVAAHRGRRAGLRRRPDRAASRRSSSTSSPGSSPRCAS